MTRTSPIIIGVTGASGSILALRLVECLLNLDQPVSLILTNKALPVIFEETGLKLPAPEAERVSAILDFLKLPAEKASLLKLFDNKQLGAPPASGTHATLGMVVIPCSMGTLGKIANGISDNLVARSADVTLKEGRKLVLVPRESPFNGIHLRNMSTLSQCGAVIIPPVLTFYLSDFQSLEGQIAYTVGKVLSQFGFSHTLHRPWGE
ncbi:MAG: UbiX family flavin prenyltransferase [Vampirovibrionales bacterium]|nr:UbiX family flavin prenyltransferase [Vampirovibrionales bacterium]